MSGRPQDSRGSESASPIVRKRPWYLIAALICAWVFGASAANEGCTTVSFYKAEHSELGASGLEHARETDRGAVDKITQRYVSVLDDAKKRVFPLGIASLLLGSVMWGLAAGAMAGRRGARTALLQVISVHALVVACAYAITPDVRQATVDARLKLFALEPEPKSLTEREAQRFVREHMSIIPAAALSLHLLGYALVLLALTRRRTREFFEAASPARTET